MFSATHEGDVRTFVHRLLRELGARVESVGPETWQAWLSQESAEALGMPAQFRFTFSPEHTGPGVELAVHGSPFVDQLVQLALRQDGVGRFVLFDARMRRCVESIASCDPWDGREEGEAPPGEARGVLARAASFRCRNGRQRLVGRRFVFHRLACFYFRVSFRSDERRELLVGVAVDPVTGDVGDAPALHRAATLPWAGQSGPAAGRDVRSYLWDRLYRRACDEVAVRVQPALAAFRREAEARAAQEEALLDVYYREMAAESVEPLRFVFRRVAQAEVQAGLAVSRYGAARAEERMRRLQEVLQRLEERQSRRLQALEEERMRRMRELQERYRVRAEARLVQAAVLYVPRIEWCLRLSGPARRELSLLHDLLQNRLLDAPCDGCGETPDDFDLCACEACVCVRCGPLCPTCGAVVGDRRNSPSLRLSAKT